ncbi:MAG: dTDP-4-dehydrorhamnose reductase [Vicinamibacterales bacterium]
MRVLVTGARGLLGAAVIREFQTDHEVLQHDRASLDVTDDAAIASAVAGAAPQVIINCAAYNQVDQAEDDPATALAVNAFGALALARAAVAANAILVHYSSDFVFDGDTDRPYEETDKANPRGVYAASKLLGDMFALEYDKAYVLRVESLFGPPGPGGSRRGSLGSIVDQIRAGAEVSVFTDRVVSPTYTPDIARATRTLIERTLPRGLYHCVNTGMATWEQIARHAATLVGMPLRAHPITLATVNLRARRPRFCAMSNAKLAAAGVAMPSWQQALEGFLGE